MKRFSLAIFLIIAYVAVFGQTKIIAHRGFWDTTNSAQNSITSVLKAEEIGCYGSEFDVQMTSDGMLVIYHDAEYMGRKITDTPYDSLRNYRLKNGEILPTLEQFLIHARNYPRVKLILEIKTNNGITSEYITSLVEAITRQISKFQLQNRTEYIAFNFDVCKEVKRVVPESVVYYLGGNLTPEQLKEAGMAGLDYHVDKFKENPMLIKQSHQLGLKVNAWTVNDPEVMKILIKAGVDFITTDKPFMLKKMLKK